MSETRQQGCNWVVYIWEYLWCIYGYLVNIMLYPRASVINKITIYTIEVILQRLFFYVRIEVCKTSLDKIIYLACASLMADDAFSLPLDPVKITWHPFLRSSFAIPNPIPLVDPVTKATLPFILWINYLSLSMTKITVWECHSSTDISSRFSIWYLTS